MINSAKELEKIRAVRRDNKIDGKAIKPKFFGHIAKQKGYYNPEKKAYVKHHTSMDYLQQSINRYRASRNRLTDKITFVPFSTVVDKHYFHYFRAKDKQIVAILNRVENLNNTISMIYSNDKISKGDQREIVAKIRQGFIEELGKEEFDNNTMIALLQTIEKPENKKYKRLLFYTLFGYPNTSFYDVIRKSKTNITEITPQSPRWIYGYKIP